MSDEHMDPSVIEFKTFVQNHPGLIQEVRHGRYSWNDLYQEWAIIGGDHADWTSYQTNPGPEPVGEASTNDTQTSGETSTNAAQNSLNQFLESNPTVSSVVSRLGQMNVNDLQGYLSQFSGVMGNVQQLMGQFQNTGGPVQNSTRENPFSFRGF
ncbi:spore coat protein YlbD [Geomicrobium sp. JCM 19039]|uniref:spore coat protein YlbD n=1 Tax=Geomicrobium sp. JCM 19039 TaxID=1460636 RepID=UPI00045F1639|nr:spore coat protein YlbD [Geomicrobium sp. JCM 19039]GAK14237.1 hypothetical protein JCM19039_4140 [Geomicrobium sp. JCM 19039]